MKHLVYKNIDWLHFLAHERSLKSEKKNRTQILTSHPYFVSASRKVWQHSRTYEDREESFIKNGKRGFMDTNKTTVLAELKLRTGFQN